MHRTMVQETLFPHIPPTGCVLSPRVCRMKLLLQLCHHEAADTAMGRMARIGLQDWRMLVTQWITAHHDPEEHGYLFAQEIEESVPVVVAAFVETSSHRRLLHNVEVQFCKEYGMNVEEDFSSQAQGLFTKGLDKHPRADMWNARLEAKLKKMAAKQQPHHGAEASSSEDEAPEDIAELDGLALEEVERPEDFSRQNAQKRPGRKKACSAIWKR